MNSVYALNEEYQNILFQMDQSLDFDDTSSLYQKLSALTSRFSRTALLYGEMIIKERYLPPTQKTIKPVSIGNTFFYSFFTLFFLIFFNLFNLFNFFNFYTFFF